MSKNLFLHFRPRSVPADALRFTLTWGLGGMAVLMIMQQLVTGVLLSFFYEPLPVLAYESIKHIENNVFFGRLVRNMHHWTGHGLVIVLFLHMQRVFFAGAFYSPRHRNWLVGLGLALFILMSNFSGYLLAWDQLSYWAVTIAISMLGYIPLIGTTLQEIMWGGGEVDAATLRLFYIIHTTIIPLSLLLFMIYHFWLIRRAGGVLLPVRQKNTDGAKQSLPINELLIRELSLAAVVTCVLLLFAMSVNAPLGDMANPQLTPTNIKAPWYFLGVQELLLHVHPVVAVFILPLSVTLFLILLPFLKTRLGKRRISVKILFMAGTILMLALTITGIWFRGPGMKLVWPW